MTKRKPTAIKPAASRFSKNTYLTSNGFSQAKNELEYLKRVKRVEIAERIRQAREYGDLSENSEYDSAVEDQSLMETRIAEL